MMAHRRHIPPSAIDAYSVARLVRDHLVTLWLRRSFAACGPHTHIHLPVRIVGSADRVRFGARVEVGPNSLIWVGGDGNVSVGDDCRITSGLHLSAAAQITLGRSVLIARSVSIIDNQHRTTDPNLPICDQGLDRIAPVEIRDGAWLGSNSVIMPGVIVGKNAIIGANAVVCQDVPDYATAVGVPARIIPGEVGGVEAAERISGGPPRSWVEYGPAAKGSTTPPLAQ
jgi:acetyltransferase-like isoleucine patch superfamily enzyme